MVLKITLMYLLDLGLLFSHGKLNVVVTYIPTGENVLLALQNVVHTIWMIIWDYIFYEMSQI